MAGDVWCNHNDIATRSGWCIACNKPRIAGAIDQLSMIEWCHPQGVGKRNFAKSKTVLSNQYAVDYLWMKSPGVFIILPQRLTTHQFLYLHHMDVDWWRFTVLHVWRRGRSPPWSTVPRSGFAAPQLRLRLRRLRLRLLLRFVGFRAPHLGHGRCDTSDVYKRCVKTLTNEDQPSRETRWKLHCSNIKSIQLQWLPLTCIHIYHRLFSSLHAWLNPQRFTVYPSQPFLQKLLYLNWTKSQEHHHTKELEAVGATGIVVSAAIGANPEPRRSVCQAQSICIPIDLLINLFTSITIPIKHIWCV